MHKLLSIAGILAFIGASALAQEGSVSLGRDLAEANCSQCHNVAPGGAMKLFPPSFAAIAAYMHPEIIPIRIMYPEAHTNMPQFHTYMNADSLAALTAYIRSLEE